MKVLRLLPVLLLAACSMPRVTSVVTPYRIDIRQGNYVSQEMIAQLKPGMTKDQVRFILGTPLLTDVFHADRWDYVYLYKPGKGEPQRRKITVFFQDGKLARLAGDVVAAEPGEADLAPAPQQREIVIGAPQGDTKAPTEQNSDATTKATPATSGPAARPQ